MQIFIQCLLLIVGFGLLIVGANWFVSGASGIAKKFKVPEILIGLTVVAFGTSIPEAAVSITASVQGNSQIAIGNVIGSNISNVLLILGICAVIRPLKVKKNTFCFEIPLTIIATAAVVLMGCFDGELQRYDGAILLVLFVFFLVYLVVSTVRSKEANSSPKAALENNIEIGKTVEENKVDIGIEKTVANERTVTHENNVASGKIEMYDNSDKDIATVDKNNFNEKNTKDTQVSIMPKTLNFVERIKHLWEKSLNNIWALALLMCVGLGMVVGGSMLSVEAAKFLAKVAGVSDAIIALTVVAIGTSLPELVTSIVATIKGRTDLAIGNIIGSVIFNIIFIIGLCALIAPANFAVNASVPFGRLTNTFLWDGLFAVGALLLLFGSVVFPKRQLGRIGGIIMLLGMVGYYVYLFVQV